MVTVLHVRSSALLRVSALTVLSVPPAPLQGNRVSPSPVPVAVPAAGERSVPLELLASFGEVCTCKPRGTGQV